MHSFQQIFTLQTSNSIQRIKFFFLLLLISQSIVHAQQQNQDNPKKVSTVYDGVTKDRYVTYLKMNGVDGASVQIPDGKSLNQNLEYTFMLWFKGLGDQWGSRLQYAFRLDHSIQCYFTASQQLICESFEKCDKLTTSTSQVATNEWTHITLSGHPAIGSYLSLESNVDLLSFDSKPYVIFRQTSWNQKACIGNCESQYGFIGGMRDFIYISQYLTNQTASRIKNHYLSWDQTIRAYYRFTSINFNKDEFRNNYAVIDSTATLAIDYIPNDICYPQLSYGNYLNFKKDNYISDINFGTKFKPKNRDWEYTVSLWVNVDPTSCTQNNPSIAEDSCSIFVLDGVMMLYLDKPNSAKFYFYAFKNYYQSQSESIFIPHNQWVNIQIAISQYKGYEIRTYDLLGRMMYYDKQERDMQEQRATKKFSLFNNLRGVSKYFVLYSERRVLPLTVPEFNDKIRSESCLLYAKFEYEFLENKKIVGQAITSNGVQHLQLNAAPLITQVIWQDYPIEGGSTDGLVTYPYNLFDGIACNDQFMTLRLESNKSYLKTQTVAIDKYLIGATVEFWYRPVNEVTQTDYLFTLWAERYQSEFFAIFLDKQSQYLMCAPFGMNSVRSPFTTYLAYTEDNRRTHRWFHIVCQYEYLKNITGYFASQNLEMTYRTQISAIPSYMPADTFSVIVGNNKDMNRGTPRLMMKEMRLWPFIRSQQEIINWRYRQVNPKDFTNPSMLSYLRMTEGGYNEYNFASSSNKDITTSVQINDIVYATNQEIIICPQQSYYLNDRCYLNPIKTALAATYPDYDSTNQTLYWIFTANFSSLLDPNIFNELVIKWQSEDPVLSDFIYNDNSKYDIRIPQSAIRDESIYPLILNITNQANTFQEILSIPFIPISCKYYIVEGSNAYQFYNNYTFAQSFSNITFKLSLVKTQPYCDDISFYNQLVPEITYIVSPPIDDTVYLEFTYNQDNSITVNIPMQEQYKLPIQTEVKFLFQVYWTNNKFSHLRQLSQYHFQDVMYTIFFNYEAQTVIPVLTQSLPYVLNSETVVLNASASYITGFNQNDQSGTLTFNWICPPSIATLCSGVSGPVFSIPFTTFLANQGTFNTTYEITAMIIWSKDGKESRFYASKKLIWYEITTPAFNFQYPTPILSSAIEQQFKITFLNYDNSQLSDLQITWSIVPNLTQPSYMNLTQNLTLLTIAKGGFKTLTNYTMSIYVINKNYPIANKRTSINFVTSQPPFGGSATITPNFGIMGSTTFTVNIQNWQSINKPIRFRIWTTTNYLGTSPQSLIVPTYFDEIDSAQFVTPSPNPILVEITDVSQEYAFFRLSPKIDLPPTNLAQMIQNIDVSDMNLKYAYMNAITQTIDVNQPYQSLSYDEQITYRETLLDQMEKDIQVISNEKSIENGDAEFVSQNATSLLQQLLINPQYINDYIMTKSFNIIESIQNSSQVYTLLLGSQQSNFTNNFANIISSLMGYTDQQAYIVYQGRRLYTSQSELDITMLFNKVNDIKNSFMNSLCSILNNNEIKQISQQALDLTLEKFNSQSNIDKKSFTFQEEDSKSIIEIKVQDILKDAQSKNIIQDPSSLCVKATFYKLNIKPLSKEQRLNMIQYSNSIVDIQISDDTGSKQLYNNGQISQFVNIYFELNPDTYKSNQTVCMTYSTEWSENYCQTNIDTKNLLINCQCNMMSDAQYFTIFTDSNRELGQSITITKSKQSQSVPTVMEISSGSAYLSVIILILGLGLIFSVSSIILDKKDYQFSIKEVDNKHQLKLLRQASIISNEPLGMWLFKRNQVLAYALPNKSLFSFLITQIHPLFSVISNFDVQNSRLTRFSLYFLQISLYGLFCVCYYGSSYRKNDELRNDLVIDKIDVDSIFSFGILGMIVLLPIPYINRLFKSEIEQDNGIVSNTNNSIRHHLQNRNQITQNEGTQEQNIIPVPIIRSQNQEDIPQTVKIIPKYQVLKFIVTLLSYVVALIVLIVGIVNSWEISISNQYCMIATFYFGFCGSIFASNLLRVALNYFLVERVYKNKNSLLRFFVSDQALRVVQDLSIIRQAQRELSQCKDKSLINRDEVRIQDIVIEHQDDAQEEEKDDSENESIQSMTQNNNDQVLPKETLFYMNSIDSNQRSLTNNNEQQLRKSITKNREQ